MNNKLHAQGKMFGLNLISITKDEMIDLRNLGKTGEVFKRLNEARNKEDDFYGFYQMEGKPTFEVLLNEASLDLKKGYKTDYEIRYLPVKGSSKKRTGIEEYFYVTEKGFKNGNSFLEFDEPFDPTNLVFDVHRIGLFNGTVCSLIKPSYKNLDFEVEWNWSGFSSEYIISTKGKVYSFKVN